MKTGEEPPMAKSNKRKLAISAYIIECYSRGRDQHNVAYDHGDVEKIKGNVDLDSSSSKPAQTSSPDTIILEEDEDEDDKESSKASDASESESVERTQTPPEEVVRYVNVTKTLKLRVDNFENIDDVKDKFSEFEGIETKVFFTKGGFENGQELDFNRKDGSSVHMNLHLGVEMQVNIKVSWGATTDDKLISLDVHSWDTISDVKAKFQDKEGTPANQLTLFYNGKQLDDLQTLAGYDIENQSTFDAFSLGEDKFVISVCPRGEVPIEVMVKLCSTVETLKRMIHCMGLFVVDRQKLIFNGVVLENSQRLADYKIQKGSKLYLDFISRTKGMLIFVQMPNWNRRFTVCVDSSDTVATVLTEIKYIEHIPGNRQSLIYAGKRLENDRTLGDYNIQKESTIYFLPHYGG